VVWVECRRRSVLRVESRRWGMLRIESGWWGVVLLSIERWWWRMVLRVERWWWGRVLLRIESWWWGLVLLRIESRWWGILRIESGWWGMLLSIERWRRPVNLRIESWWGLVWRSIHGVSPGFVGVGVVGNAFCNQVLVRSSVVCFGPLNWTTIHGMRSLLILILRSIRVVCRLGVRVHDGRCILLKTGGLELVIYVHVAFSKALVALSLPVNGGFSTGSICTKVSQS